MNEYIRKYLRKIYLEDEIKDILIVNDFISVNVKIEDIDSRCFPVLKFLYVHFINDEVYISSNKPILIDSSKPLNNKLNKKSKNKVKFSKLAERPSSKKEKEEDKNEIFSLERSMKCLDLSKNENADEIKFTLYNIKINYITNQDFKL